MNDLEQRIKDLETKFDIMMSLINHINNTISDKVIDKIEIDFEEAVNRRIDYMKDNNKND